MFLNSRHPADTFVVGISLIIDRYQANDLGFSTFAKDFDAQMPVEQMKAIAILRISRDGRWFYNPNLCD